MEVALVESFAFVYNYLFAVTLFRKSNASHTLSSLHKGKGKVIVHVEIQRARSEAQRNTTSDSRSAKGLRSSAISPYAYRQVRVHRAGSNHILLRMSLSSDVSLFGLVRGWRNTHCNSDDDVRVALERLDDLAALEVPEVDLVVFAA